MSSLSILKRMPFLLNLAILSVTLSEQGITFHKIYPCYNVSMCSWNQSRFVQPKLKCLGLCGHTNSCKVVSFEDHGYCRMFDNSCFVSNNCPQNNTRIQFYLKRVCGNGGLWDFETQSCSCRDSWIGDRCELLARTCEELKTHGFQVKLFELRLNLYNNQSKLVRAYCDVLSTGEVRTYLFRNSGRKSFNKTWDEYVQGFYFDVNHHWVGLEALHVMTKTNSAKTGTLVFQVTFKSPGDPCRRTLEHQSFRVGDESEGYAYNYTFANQVKWGICPQQSGQTHLPTFMSNTQNLKFSTPDRDNDLDLSRSCANEAGAGWWFRLCTEGINPLGLRPASRTRLSTLQHLALPGVDTGSPDLDSVEMYFRTQ